MRRCITRNCFSHRQSWACRGLRTSSRSQPRAIKQLNNAELLSLMQTGKKDRASSLEDPAGDDVTTYQDTLIRSPLTEHRLVAARARYRQEKPQPSKERSPFQLQLERNPYAQILSTPPRLCLLTGIRLPSDFLIPFGIEKHPTTGAPWHLPRLSNPNGNPSNHDTNSLSSSQEPVSDSLSKTSTRTATGTHFVASREAFSHISGLTKQAYRRLMPYRWKEDPSLKIPDIVWREDMADFILENMRKTALRDLQYLSSRPAAYIAACSDYDNVTAHGQVGAVLWVGHDRTPSVEGVPPHGTSGPEDRGPPPYAMHHYKGHYVPIYNLVSILGDTHVRSLRESNPARFGGQMAVMKAKRPTMNVQIQLWKLLGYLSKAACDDNVAEDRIYSQSDV